MLGTGSEKETMDRKEQTIQTLLGQIGTAIDDRGNGPPILFMHGVFLDRTLWGAFDSRLTGRTHIYIDMPAHGTSSNVGWDWGLDDCVEMLLQILDDLKVEKCSLVGHSWGSMTALHAAYKHPSKFLSLGLFNMPFQPVKGMSRVGFQLQKLMAAFPRFYAKQAAKSLYSKDFLQTHPEMSEKMQERLSKRPPREISRVIDAVILNAEDATGRIRNLRVPALALVGESDYVGSPPEIETMIVPGGHISPHEAPDETRMGIKKVARLAHEAMEVKTL